MKIETRLLTEAELHEYAGVCAYAYNQAPSRLDEEFKTVKQLQQLPQFGVFADGKLAAGLIDHRFDLWVNGATVKANGIGAVASAPETRRLGLVRELMAAHLRQLREGGVVLSMLYPFAFSFYARLGWAPAVRGLEIKLAPAQFAAYGRRTGNARRVMYAEKGLVKGIDGEDEASVATKLDAIYSAATRGVNLCAVRGLDNWKNIFTTQSGRRHVVIWEDQASVAQGYAVYRIKEEDFPADFAIREIFALTPEAWRGLCFYISCHDSHIRTVNTVVPPEHPLLELVDNPRIEQSKLAPGAMARIVDIPGFLAARGNAGAVAGECTLHVTDRLAPWNEGSWTVGFDGSEATVKRVETGSDHADVAADIGALTQLAVGYRGLDELILFGLIRGREGPGLDFARAFFPVRPTRHLEYY